LTVSGPSVRRGKRRSRPSRAELKGIACWPPPECR
jgi:hypothetical protein